jgi:hypothetical protein
MKNIAFIIFFIFASLLQAQVLNVMINDQFGPNEPSIFMDPDNTNRLVAGSNLDLFYYSDDGGYTWTTQKLASSHGVWGDPCVIIDTAGHIYFFHLSNPPAGNWIDRIVCQKSEDNGMTWTDGTFMGLEGTKAQDKEWAVVDRTNNNIYVTWTQFDDYGSSNPADSSIIRFSKSTDGGLTWSPAVRINKYAGDCVDKDETVEGAVPTVGPNGEIYVSWTGPQGIRFNRSLDEGDIWLEEEILVSDQPGGWDLQIPGIMRCNGLPVTACDISGGLYNGHIYVNWTDQRNGTADTDVWIVKSVDGGDTWSAPLRVNDDPSGKHQFFSWMTIDQVTGFLWIVYYDRRNDTLNMNATEVFVAVSKDGGLTFENHLISESPFIPTQTIFFGDYTNIAAHNNVVRPVWLRMHNNQRMIMTAIINDPELSTDGFLSVIPFSVEQNYPNPFNDYTWIAFRVERPAYVTVMVVDIYGREVVRLYDNEFLLAGRYIQQFDARLHQLSSGVYFYKITTGRNSISGKMIVQ